jgi:hypothetical protein
VLDRQTWHVDHLEFVDERLISALVKYRQYEDRQPTAQDANVVSSHIIGTSKHAPILDLDFPHRYVPSTTPGHAHLYLDVPISRWRLFILLWGLYVGGVIEKGTFYWSLRRGGTFMRREGVKKTAEEAAVTYSYGLFFKLRRKS